MAEEKRKNRDIQNILTVLSAAIICAALLSVVFIYYYGPSGRYVAGHTLLDPAIIEQINYQDKHPRTGKNVHFIFDHMEFSYFDSQKGEQKKTISLENYQKLYQLIASEKSLEEVSDQIKDFFVKSRPTLLTTRMRTTEGADTLSTKIFQVVQFVQEDYFRVQLPENQEQGEWAYFYHPHLYQDLRHLFTPTEKL